jgi:hypothetical protein
MADNFIEYLHTSDTKLTNDVGLWLAELSRQGYSINNEELVAVCRFSNWVDSNK